VRCWAIFDGMNLVAVEGPSSTSGTGVGAVAQRRVFARLVVTIAVNRSTSPRPHDRRGAEMPEDERVAGLRSTRAV
jgi:hypothetical protein